MKKILFFLTLLTFLSLSWGGAARAQETVTIGDGTSTSNQVPIGTYYNYSITEQLYTAEEIGMAGTISSISFYYMGIAANELPITVYMQNVDAADLSTGIGLAEADEVFSGNLSVTTTAGWVTIDLTTPFEYDGSSNLLIGIIKDYLYYFSGQSWQGTSVSNMARYTQSDNNGPYTTSTVPSNAASVRPNIQLSITPAHQGGDVCEKPSTCEATNVTATSATLTWGGGSGIYNVEVKGGNRDYADWTAVLSNTNLTTTTLSLEPTTSYQARVQSVCDGLTPTSNWKTSASFTTPCSTYDIPYTYDFETEAPFACWKTITGVTRANSSSNAHNGDYYMKFSGTTSNLVALPQFNAPTNTLRVEFYTRPESNTNSSCGTFSVGYMTDITDASTFVEVANYAYNDWTSATHVKKTVDFINAPANANIAFRHNAGSSSWYWYADDVTVKNIPSCVAPSGLAANATTESAELSWTANSGETAWTLYYKKTSDENYTEVTNVTENPYRLNGLTAATNYQFYVVANCSASDNSEASDVQTFATECEVISAVDYNVNFDDYTVASAYTAPSARVLPTCWNAINTTTYNTYSVFPSIYYYSSTNYANSTPNCLKFYSTYSSYSSYDPQPQYAILPEMNDLAGMQITLQARGYNTNSTFFIGVMTDPTDASTFVAIANEQTLTTSYQEFEFYVPADARGNYLSIMIEAANSARTTNGLYVDDITITTPPACIKPTGLSSSNVTAHEATITWTSDAEAWQVQLNEEDPIDVHEATYTFTGLDPVTAYTAKVRTNCDGTYSEWTNAVSFTTLVACPVPTVTVSNITAYTAVVNCNNTNAENFNVILGGDTVENVHMPFELRDLAPNTSYTVKVQAICGGHDGESQWTSGTSFMTAEICPDGMVCIGTGTSTSNDLPVNNYYKYSLTEQIYTAEEIGMAGSILSIDFYKAATTAAEKDLNIYMVATDKDEFESTSDWITVSASDLVYSGTVTFVDNDWTTIELDAPFNYDGRSNLAIVVDNNTGAYVSNTAFRTFSDVKNRTLYYRSDSNNPDPMNPSVSANTTAQKNRIRIAIGEPPACLKPTGVTASNVTAHEATINWNSDAAAWEIQLNEEEPISVTDTTTYTFTHLVPETTYAVKVRAICGHDYSDWTTAINFTTAIACPVPTGLAANVEGATATITWTSDATAFNIDINGTVTENVTSPYILNGELATNYTVKVQANCGDDGYSQWTNPVSFTTDMCLAENQCEITLVLTDSYGDGWNGNAIKVVDVLTNTVLGQFTISSGSSATHSLTVCNGRELQFSWVSGSYPDETSYEVYDINQEIIFEGSDAMSAPVNYTVNCTPSTCAKPTSVTVSYTGGTEATISWTSDAEAWNMRVNGVDVNGVITNPYTLTGLNLATTYNVEVQANCGEGLSDWTIPVSFTTDPCMPENQCQITFVVTDSYGDGWNGASIEVKDVMTGIVIATIANENLDGTNGVETQTITLNVCDGREIQFVWNSGNYDSEASYVVTDLNGAEIFSGSGAMSAPVNYTVNCTPCQVSVVNFEQTICANELPYTWNGVGLTEAGTYTDTLTTVNGCDSVVIMTLTVNPVYVVNLEQTICPSLLPFEWNGVTFNEAGTQTATLETVNGCDSVVTMTLNLYPVYHVADTQIICSSQLPINWNDVTITEAGNYTKTWQTVNGCDSVETMTLIVNPSYEVSDVRTICASELPYTWNDVEFTEAGTQTTTLSTINGCDSVVTMTLTVNPTYNVTDEKTICASELPYRWNGVRFAQAGTKTAHLQTVNGCDSAVTMTLNVNPTYNVTDELTICASELPYTWNGVTFNAAGTQTVTLETVNGCDSVVTMILTVTSISLPYYEDFESYTTSTTEATGEEPSCWELVQQDVSMPASKRPQLYYSSSYAHSGNYSLRLYNRGIYAMPALDDMFEASQVQLKMYVRQPKSQYMLQVGVLDDEGNFEAVATIDNQSTGVEHVVCNFAGYTGNGRRIAFRNVLEEGYSTTYSVNYIDDISLTVACQPITLPYYEDFESYTTYTTEATGVEPTCWDLVQEDVSMPADKRPQLYYKSSYAHSGNYSLMMYNRGIYAMPELDGSLDQVQLKMYVRQPKSQYMLQVGVLDNEGNFEAVATIDNQSTGTEHVVCTFEGYTGNGNRIAFRNVLAEGYSTVYSVNYIDDISLTYSCQPITLPYYEDFESYTNSTTATTGVEPTCWDLVQEDVTMPADKRPQLYYRSYYAHSGDYSLMMYNRGIYAMPELANAIDINQLQLDMYVRQPKSQYMLQVGVLDDEGNFEAVTTINNQSTGIEHVVCTFEGYTGNGHRIAFRNVLADGYTTVYSVNYIDDINITTIVENMDRGVANTDNDNEVSGETAVDSYLKNIALYPNPTTGPVNIDAVEVQRVECYTISGQLMAVFQGERNIDISNLPAGVYMFRITLPEGTIIRKVVRK